MMQKRILTNVQQLRGIAASAVLLAHVQNSIYQRVYGTDVFLIDGTVGVDIFFVISGFIMVGVTHGAFAQPGSARHFLLRRIARIVPIYWILTSVMGALFVIAGSAPGLLETICSYLFIPFEFNGKVRPILGQGWTLELEMMFYALFSVCLLFKRNIGLALLSATLVAMAIIGTAIESGPLHFWMSPIILEFLVGILVGLAFRTWGREILPGHLLLNTALLVAWMFAVYHAGAGSMFDWRWGSWLAAGAMVAIAVFSRQTEARTHLSRGLVWLGDISYSLYLVHIIVLLVVAKMSDTLIGERLSLPLGLAYGAIVIVGSLTTAALCYRYLERPCESLALRLFSATRKPKAA